MLSAHRVRVVRLYRQLLRNTLNWYVARTDFNAAATALRARFDANRGLKDPLAIEKAVSEASAYLSRTAHPDKYNPCWAPMGSKFQRNEATPAEIIDPDLWEKRFSPATYTERTGQPADVHDHHHH